MSLACLQDATVKKCLLLKCTCEQACPPADLLNHLLHRQSRPAALVQVSTANLERVRKVKTRHQRLMARVTTVREELERFLEDDDDMMKMCLSRRREVRPPPVHALEAHVPGQGGMLHEGTLDSVHGPGVIFGWRLLRASMLRLYAVQCRPPRLLSQAVAPSSLRWRRRSWRSRTAWRRGSG